MSVWSRIAEAMGLSAAPDALQVVALTEAAGVSIDADDVYYRPLAGQHPQRDLSPIAQSRMQELVWYLWDSNGLANRLIELPLAYLLAEGVRLACDDEEAQGWLDAFWKDGVNRMDRKLKEYVRCLKLFGELCLPVFVNEVSGRCRLGYIDPVTIDGIVKDPENPALEIGVIVRPKQGGDRRLYKIILAGPDEELLGVGARRLREGMRDGQCFYWRRNALPNSGRGRSDLLPSIDHCDAYNKLLFGEVDRADALRMVLWDVTLKGANKDEVKARAREIQSPRPHSIRVHNDSEVWDTITPDMKAGDASETARLIRGHVLGSRTLPEHWMGQGDVNRASGESMAEPTFKVLTDEQNEIQGMLVDLGRFVLRSRIKAVGLAPADWEDDPAFQVRADMPDLASRDVARFAQALGSVVASCVTALDQGLLTEETVMRFIALVAAQMGLEINPAEELAKARAQKAQRRGGDAFSSDPDPNFDPADDADEQEPESPPAAA
ncbi:hypothetical protein [Niveispirillum cyanobacteriorum]|uniref:Uncharacterized protein n=1 Tax=Niveispirillum cyanobacteriorum TaxID=1612173 RepID=A0A2K9NDS7_9PROT|nr:hypothetical protein [Niveispirillum cyanobacteriorum]AUN31247.1 hypothetical protein C0V82_14145 [Niveispirillum cyanobacteriorum]GGE72968.1 hypothetical protein GCM10011317_32740 [Niveispirillum cyanobacteriorum]